MIHTLIAGLTSFALFLINRSGYFGLFLLSLLESAAIPIPSEIVVPFSGYLVAIGRFSFVYVVLLATLGNLAGSLVLYWLGRSGGRYILERYGKYLFINHKELLQGDHWFHRYGKSAVFFGRILPGIRTFISFAPGVTRMNVYEFSVYTFLGALPWNAALAWFGYKAGEHWDFLHQYFRIFDIIIVGAVGVFVVWYIWRHIKIKN